MAPHLIKLRQIEGGLPAGGGGGSVATFTPTLIPSGQSFTVPDNAQVLYALPIIVEGDLIVDGDLVEVD